MSEVNMKPIAGSNNRVIIKPAEAETKTASGIFIPDTAKEKPNKGTVIAVSEKDEKGVEPVLKAGDIVLYGKYAGQELPNSDFVVMRESDILVVIS